MQRGIHDHLWTEGERVRGGGREERIQACFKRGDFLQIFQIRKFGNCFGIENAAVLRVWLELFFCLFYPHVQECHLLVLNASGQVTSRVVLHPSVDSSGYIVKVGAESVIWAQIL